MRRIIRDADASDVPYDVEAGYQRLQPFIADANKDIAKNERRLALETILLVTTFIVGVVVINKIV